jgi:malate permease and related proteins
MRPARHQPCFQPFRLGGFRLLFSAMTSYVHLLGITLPVFGLFGLGVLVRRLQWLTEEAETSLLKLIINCFYPCLILQSVLGNAALRDPGNLAVAPLVGFGTIALGMAVGYYAGRALGLTTGHGLRTFAFAVGVFNYGYIAIPLVGSLWDQQTVGVLLVHNVGCELAIWTIGILLLSGLSLREGWRKTVNPVVCTLVVGVVLNTLHVQLPRVAASLVEALGACTIPLGLLFCGATVETYLRKPRELFNARVSIGASLLRLGALPLAFLALAKWVPLTLELKRVLVVEAAMPAGMFPLVIARHYGGQPLTAARIIIATTALGLLLIPLWIAFGLRWVGV